MRRFLSIRIILVASVAVGLSGWGSLGIALSALRAGNSSGDSLDSLRLGEERVPAGEDEVIKELVALQVAIMRHADPKKRGQHPKSHGCVEAEFIVRGDIPEKYRIGIFKEPKSYKAKIRYSNGASADDTKPDVHGMAVKVFDVK